MKYFDNDDIRIPFGFYLKEGRKVYTYCSNCGAENEFTLKPNEKIKEFVKKHYYCSCCNEDYKLYNAKLSNNYTGAGTFKAEFAKTEKGFDINIYFISYNFGEKNYDIFPDFLYDDYSYCLRRHPIFDEYVSVKFVFEEGKKVKYFADEYLNFTHRCSCPLEEKNNFPYFHSAFEYNKESLFCLGSLAEFENTKYHFLIDKISDIYTFSNNIYDFLCTLICLWNYPGLTTLYNSGFKSLAVHYSVHKLIKFYYGSIRLNLRSNNITKILGIDPSKIKMDRKTLDYSDLYVSKKLCKSCVDATSANVEIMRICVDDYVRLGILSPIILKYLRHQSKMDFLTKLSVASTYLDYLKEIDYLGFDKTSDVLFPTNLHVAHQRTSEAVKQLKAEKGNEIFHVVAMKYKNFDYFGDDYSVELVKSSKSLINAANYLHNCSASYIDDVSSGRCLIFLVKKHKSSIDGMLSLVLNESRPRISQLFAIYNKAVTSEVRSFVDFWYHDKVLKLCA